MTPLALRGICAIVRGSMQGDMDIVDPRIDAFLARLAGSPDPVEAEMRRYADERDGFPIVGPAVGQTLMTVALMLNAKRILEVGSGFGYSAFWLARALPQGGQLTLTEHDRDLLERARAWLTKAGLASLCRFEPGDGLAALARAEPGLDLVFLDGAKAEYPRALALALPKLRRGGAIVADNVLWGGSVVRGETDEATAGVREYIRLIHASDALVSSIVPLRDGLAITLKR
jgi:predicted O-methyltransferase YrrM